jgi:hypothetical protein
MEAIKVLVRVRPVETHEPSVVSISGDKVISVDSSRFIQCKYNHVFPPTSTQSEVYSHLREYVTPLLNGINVTLMTYGQTSSGKTHSMFGRDGRIDVDGGVVPRVLKDLFDGLVNTRSSNVVSVALLQIYNEEVYDMFDKTMRPLSIQEHDGNVSVKNMGQYKVDSYQQSLALVDLGLKCRTVRETGKWWDTLLLNDKKITEAWILLFVSRNESCFVKIAFNTANICRTNWCTW